MTLDKEGRHISFRYAQTMWTAMGGGGSWNVHFTNKAYLVKLSTKGEGGQKSPKIGPHGLCMDKKCKIRITTYK